MIKADHIKFSNKQLESMNQGSPPNGRACVRVRPDNAVGGTMYLPDVKLTSQYGLTTTEAFVCPPRHKSARKSSLCAAQDGCVQNTEYGDCRNMPEFLAPAIWLRVCVCVMWSVDTAMFWQQQWDRPGAGIATAAAAACPIPKRAGENRGNENPNRHDNNSDSGDNNSSSGNGHSDSINDQLASLI